MRGLSGVLVIDPEARQSGRTVIDFEPFPADGARVGDAILTHRRQVGTDRHFAGDPAFVVHFREYVAEDRARVGGEKDWWELDSSADRHQLHVAWTVHDGGAEVREIGFLVVG